MATLWISEYGGLTQLQAQSTPVVHEPALVEQTPVTISGTSAQSAAFGSSTRLIRVQADVACHILVGANPTATTSSKPLAANADQYYDVHPGAKIAVIQAA